MGTPSRYKIIITWLENLGGTSLGEKVELKPIKQVKDIFLSLLQVEGGNQNSHAFQSRHFPLYTIFFFYNVIMRL